MGACVHLLTCLHDHAARRAQAEHAHHQRHEQVRQRAAGPPHAERREQHGKVADHVVACAEPDRAHVGVAVAEGEQQGRNQPVGGQRGDADRAHGVRFRHRAGRKVRQRGADHEHAVGAHGRALDQCGARAPDRRQAKHEQGNAVVGGVAEEVDRVGQQRDRARRPAAEQLDAEHQRVHEQRDPEHAPVARIDRRVVGGTAAAAAIGHRILQPDVIQI
jgi:hypothetical protein